MSQKSEYERVAHKAHEIWESEGRPHGREQAHWDQAKEIVALHDSMGETMLPRETGAAEAEESLRTASVNGDMPGLTDQGKDDLTDIDREPEVTKPSKRAAAETAVVPAAKPAKSEAAGSAKPSGKAAKRAASKSETKAAAKPEGKSGAKTAASKHSAKGQPSAGKR